MTLRLIITRHAKSDWGAADLDDHDRHLNARGQRAALAMGDWLVRQGHDPQQILCSTATRVQETVDGMLQAFAHPIPRQSFGELYLSSPQTMLDFVRKHASTDTVMMVAHNPGSAIFAQMICARAPDDPDFARYPTCFTSVFEFEVGSWDHIDWGLGSAIATMAPRRLEP